MSRTRLLMLSATLGIVLSACGGGQQSQLTPPTDTQPAAVDQSAQAPGLPATQEQTQATSASPTEPTSSDAGTAMSATTVAPQAVGIPKHIKTWAYDLYWGRGAKGTAAQVQTYLNYAQGGMGNSKASADCGSTTVCQSVFYFDPHFFYDTVACGLSGDAKDIAAKATESWFVHESGYTDAAHRVQGRYTQTCGGRSVTSPVYAMNTSNNAVRSFYNSYLHANAANYDMFFIDDTSGRVLTQFYGPGGGFCQNAANHYCMSTHEMPSDSYVVSEHANLANSLTRSNGSAMTGVFNGVNFTNGRMNDVDVLTSSKNFVGATCEGCVVSGGALRPTMYASVLNAMAQVNATENGMLILMSTGKSAPGSTAQIEQRKVTSGVAWLGYSWGHTVVWPDLEQNLQNLAIFPENSIFPYSPIQTMSSGATDLQVRAGVYRREFRQCYNAGAAIGPCAAIVNSTGANVVISSTWLHQTYGHVIQMVGGDIPSGGHLALTSTAFRVNSTYVGPSQALLIAR